ncbi:MAG: nucleotidyltransferase family protein [Solirubrobacteraceae bacterium]
MAVPQAVQEAYTQARPLIESVAAIVKPTVVAWTEQHEYFFRGRVKTVESLAEKLECGRIASWAEVDDLYAAEVVVPTLEHVSPTLEHLRRSFRPREIRGPGVSQKSPQEFRFDATRFIGTVVPQEGLTRLAGVEELLFEVQILTAFEYAWQVATHDSVYKGDAIDWRRQRLAAHLRAAAEQADYLIAAFDSAAEIIPLSLHRDTERREQIVSLCRRELEDERIPESLQPESWVRFADNVLSLVKRYAKRDKVDRELDTLLAALEARIAEGGVPFSGTLFQLVVSLVVQLKGVNALRSFPLVESIELRDLYGIMRVPRRVAM